MSALLKLDSIISLASNDSDVVGTENPLVFIKEVAHVGTFHKGDQKIPITEKMLNHWVSTFAEMSAEGIEVPVPLEHTKDPEKRRGRVLSLSKRVNSRGLPALYAKIKFRDAEAAKLSHSGVSLFCPMQAQSGTGKTFKIPVQHICITDYPVISGLEPFKPIALSFGGPPEKENKPEAGQSAQAQAQNQPPDPMRMLANMLGVSPAISDPQQLAQTIMQMVQTLIARGSQSPAMAQPRAPMPGQPPMMPIQPQQMQAPTNPVGQPPGAPPPKKSTNSSGRPAIAAAFSLEDLPEDILMALSKKQMKKIVKSIKKGKKVKISGPDRTNTKPHFGSSLDPDDSLGDGDDPFVDQDNDAFENGCDNHEENEDMFSPSKGGDGLSYGSSIALSGSVLDAVKDARLVQIDQLFAAGHINAHVRKGMVEKFVESRAVAFSGAYDDGFKTTLELLRDNGRVMPTSKTGPQIDKATQGALALSHQGEANPILADAERRASGKDNFNL